MEEVIRIAHENNIEVVYDASVKMQKILLKLKFRNEMYAAPLFCAGVTAYGSIRASEPAPGKRLEYLA